MADILSTTAFQYTDIWYAVPLIVATSLVYAATRHEESEAIFVQSLRTGVWIVSFMAVVFGVLLLMAWWL